MNKKRPARFGWFILFMKLMVRINANYFKSIAKEKPMYSKLLIDFVMVDMLPFKSILLVVFAWLNRALKIFHRLSGISS
jgi:hypothetical protein